MMNALAIGWKWSSRLALPALLAIQIVSAQGMGGMPGMPGGTAGTTGGMGGGMMTGNAKGMATGMNALGMMTIGPDGTIYLMRRLQDTSATTPGMQMNSTSDQFEMVAMNGADGSTKWTITLPGVMMSAPVLAPDGKIFMSSGSTTFDGQGLEGGMMNAQGSSVISPASMIMVTSTGSSAQIGAQVAVDSQMMGDPQIGKNPDGSYTVYMTGFAISSTTQQQGLGMSLMADGEMYLYAFQSNGTLKYKTDLGAAQMGYGPGYAMKGQRRMTMTSSPAFGAAHRGLGNKE